MAWNQVHQDCTSSVLSTVPWGGLLSKGQPDLIWTAREIFRFPRQEEILANQDALLKLLDWALTRKSAEAYDLKPELLNGNLKWDELELDYTSLFINAFPTAKAHPFAGWYRGEKIVFGDSDLEMRQFYSRYGVDFDDDQSLPADHIMVELEFLAGMAENYIESGNSYCLLAMQELMSGHMQYWLFQFLETMQKHAQSSYYRNLASVLLVLFTELTEELKGVA